MRDASILTIRFTRSLVPFVLASAVMMGSPSFAQTDAASRQALCATDRAAIAQLSTSLRQAPLWDDVTIARGRASLAKLQTSRLTIMRLIRRLNSAEQSAANAEAFDKSGEAGFWRRNAVNVRAAIDAEKKKAKAFAADAGVTCPGCTYSLLISKVEAAINDALSARSQAFQVQQQIAGYRANLAAAGCRG